MSTRKSPHLPGSVENQTSLQENTDHIDGTSDTRPQQNRPHQNRPKQKPTKSTTEPNSRSEKHIATSDVDAEINECSPAYKHHPGKQSTQGIRQGVVKNIGNQSPNNNDADAASGLSMLQQQFMLKFCRQLVSVIEACEQSESAEIEVGRRQIDSHQIKVKLQAEREFTHRGIK